MPAVYLTEEQRQQAALQRQYQKIADGLAAFLNREHLRQVDIAKGLGMHHTTVRKLLNAEPVNVDVIRIQKVLRLAGYKIVPIKKEEEE